MYFTISYGTGQIEGTFYDDVINLGSFNLEDQIIGGVYNQIGDSFKNVK